MRRTNPLLTISLVVSVLNSACVSVLYGYEPDQCKQMSVSISEGCTSTVTQGHSHRKRLAGFGLILVLLRDVVTMKEGLKGWRAAGGEM